MRIRSVFNHSAQVIAEGALLSLLVVGLMAGTTLAAKGGGCGATTTGGKTGTVALRIVTDTNGNNAPNWGDSITFDVTANVSYPMVNVTCMQGTTQVDNQSNGFYIGWPWSKSFPLSNWYSWTSGGADCVATLYYQTTKGNVTLKTLAFTVAD